MTTNHMQMAPTPARRTQAERRISSDDCMLNAACELLARNGLRGTSLADIGVRAGYSRGLPVERFGSKLGLIQALLDSMDMRITRAFEDAIKGLRGWEAFFAAARVQLHSSSNLRGDRAAAFRAIRMECRYAMPEVSPVVAILLERWRRFLTSSIEQGQNDGTMRHDISADRLSKTAVAILNDDVLNRDPGDSASEEEVRELFDHLRLLFAP